MALARVCERGIVLDEAQRGRQRDAQPVHAMPEHAEDRGKDREAEDQGRQHGGDAADAHAAQGRRLEHDQAPEADRDRDAAHGHRLADGGHRALDRIGDRPMPELLPESADREEGVVDRERQADHRRHVRDEDAHLGDAGEERDDRHRAGECHPGDDHRQHRADQGAEDGEEDQHRDRQADDLGLEEVPLDRLVELVLDERDAGDGRLDPGRSVDERGEVLGIVDRGLDLLIESDQREGLRAVTAHEGGVADVGVGEDLAHHRIVRERRHRLGDGRLERLGACVAVGVGEDHDQARRLLSEPVGRQRFGLRGFGTLDLPAALAQRPTGRRRPDVEPDDEREARDRQPAPVAVGEAPESGEDAVVRGAVIRRRRGRRGCRLGCGRGLG